MGLWELWQQGDDSGTVHTFVRADLRLPLDDPRWCLENGEPELIWTVEASSYIEAMCRYHEHMGYEPYQPMLGEDGNPLPDDEAPL